MHFILGALNQSEESETKVNINKEIIKILHVIHMIESFCKNKKVFEQLTYGNFSSSYATCDLDLKYWSLVIQNQHLP